MRASAQSGSGASDDGDRREAILRRAPALRQRAKDAMQEFLAGKLSEAEMKDAQAAAANADGIGIDAGEQTEVAVIDARRGLLEDAAKELNAKINVVLRERQKIERLYLWYEVKDVRKEAAEALTEVARVMVKLGRLEDRYAEAGGGNERAAMRNLTFARRRRRHPGRYGPQPMVGGASGGGN